MMRYSNASLRFVLVFNVRLKSMFNSLRDSNNIEINEEFGSFHRNNSYITAWMPWAYVKANIF